MRADVQFSRDEAIFAIGFAAVLDTLIMALAFKVAAPRFLKNLIRDAENP